MATPKLTTLYEKDFEAADIERKHIILLDGTWNDETGIGGDGNVTNIVHLKRLLSVDPEKQIVTYHRGVGNDNDNNKLISLFKGAIGTEVDVIVDNAYARFVQNWRKGDRVYIFGFSRGAASARLLATKICKMGIPAEIEITLKAKINSETKVVEQAIETFKINRSKKPCQTDIELLGVWDTVASIGIRNNITKVFNPNSRNLFQDYHIAENIKKAVHLVALDETRSVFSVGLMNNKPGVTHEVWFPGVHSDIGGSYPQGEDGITKVTLHYMLKCMEQWNEQRGLAPFLINEKFRKLYTTERTDHASFHFHGKKGLVTGIRKVGVQVNGKIDKSIKPKIHRLLNDLVEDNSAYAVFEVEKKGSKEKETKSINFQYMPFQLELIREVGYDVVE